LEDYLYYGLRYHGERQRREIAIVPHRRWRQKTEEVDRNEAQPIEGLTTQLHRSKRQRTQTERKPPLMEEIDRRERD